MYAQLSVSTQTLYTVVMGRTTALLLLLAAAGCADDAPTSPTPASLEGTWRIISIQPASQPLQTAPVSVRYQVAFDNGLTFVRVDCNTCTGPFESNDGRLTIGPSLACTRASCATASYESAVLTLLSGDHQMSSTLHNLTLSSSRGTVLLQR